MYENYEKYSKKAWVRSDLKGKQKEFCMCWDCENFEPETDDKGCDIIKNVLTMATERNIVLPVWECGEFEEK